MAEKLAHEGYGSRQVYGSARPTVYDEDDVFGNEESHDIRYKTLTWPMVSVLMIAEIVSNGMVNENQHCAQDSNYKIRHAFASIVAGSSVSAATPRLSPMIDISKNILTLSSSAYSGIVPGIILIVFLGTFATYTSWLLVQFKLNHPEVHTMGDAGYILFGPIGREILAFGTVVFAIFATGGQLLAGQIALASLSDNKLCTMLYAGIFAIPTLLCSFPRTFDGLSWLSLGSVTSIIVAGIVGMVAAGLHPEPGREVDIVRETSFYTAFISVTNPVFAYAGHFM